MVVQGGFSLQLIDAETQQPLNEYRGPSGSVYYAEAKPGGEYFLRFQVLKDEGTPQSEHETMMYFRPSVDGKDLGFYTNLTKSQGARDVGLWTYINGIGTNQALKFDTEALPVKGATSTTTPTAVNGHAAAVSDGDVESTAASGRKSPPLLLMGNVQVKVSKGVFTGYQKRISTAVPALTQEETVMAEMVAPISASSSLQEEEEDANGNTPNGVTTEGLSASADSKTADPVPVLRSREGAAKFQQAFSDECPTYQPGDLLETITIHYGSTAALIQTGILVPITGAVPEFVGVPPPPVAVVPHPPLPPAVVTAPAPPALLTSSVVSKKQEELLVPNPLLNTSPSSPKRKHSLVSEAEGTTTTVAEEQEPVAKKACHQVASEAVVAAVVSTK